MKKFILIFYFFIFIFILSCSNDNKENLYMATTSVIFIYNALSLYTDFPIEKVIDNYYLNLNYRGLFDNITYYPDYWSYLNGVKNGILNNTNYYLFLNGNIIANIYYDSGFKTNILASNIIINTIFYSNKVLNLRDNDYSLTNEFFDCANEKYYVITKIIDIIPDDIDTEKEFCSLESSIYLISNKQLVKKIYYDKWNRKILIGYGLNKSSGFVILGNGKSDLVAYITNIYTEITNSNIIYYNTFAIEDLYSKTLYIYNNFSNNCNIERFITQKVGSYISALHCFTPKNRYIIYSDRKGGFRISPENNAFVYGNIRIFDIKNKINYFLDNRNKLSNDYKVPSRFRVDEKNDNLYGTIDIFHSISLDLKSIYLIIETNDYYFLGNVYISTNFNTYLNLHDGSNKNEMRGIYKIDISSLNLSE